MDEGGLLKRKGFLFTLIDFFKDFQASVAELKNA